MKNLKLKLKQNDVSLICSALFQERYREVERLNKIGENEFPIVKRIMQRTIEKQTDLIDRLDKLVNP